STRCSDRATIRLVNPSGSCTPLPSAARSGPYGLGPGCAGPEAKARCHRAPEKAVVPPATAAARRNVRRFRAMALLKESFPAGRVRRPPERRGPVNIRETYPPVKYRWSGSRRGLLLLRLLRLQEHRRRLRDVLVGRLRDLRLRRLERDVRRRHGLRGSLLLNGIAVAG